MKQKQRQKHLTWAKEKKTELSNEFNQVLSGPKSSLQMKVNFAFHLEIKVWSMEEDSKLFEVQCEVSTVSDDLGCHAVCWCWSIVFYQVKSQRNRLPGDFADKLYGDAYFLFQQDFSTCPHCQNHFEVIC